MARLVKIADGQVFIAYQSVHAPGYTLLVADAPAPQDGWVYHAADVDESDFVVPWMQPTGAHDAYAQGAVVSHNGNLWHSLLNANVWEPGVSGWAQDAAGMLAWVQPTGAHDAYPVDAVVSHGGKHWRSLLDANVWEPGVSGWRETLLSNTAAAPAWVQPTGAHDAYQIGDRVTYNGQTWVCTVANNVWAPGVYGWVVE